MALLAGHSEPVPLRDDGDGFHGEAWTEHNVKAVLLVSGGVPVDHDGAYPAIVGSVTMWGNAALGEGGMTTTLEVGPHELSVVRFGPVPPVFGGGGIV